MICESRAALGVAGQENVIVTIPLSLATDEVQCWSIFLYESLLSPAVSWLQTAGQMMKLVRSFFSAYLQGYLQLIKIRYSCYYAHFVDSSFKTFFVKSTMLR